MVQERYSRNLPAISEAELETLLTKKVAIVGCGGLGGNLIEQICRLGIGQLRVIDGDVFEPSNLNRQLLSTAENMGYPKAKAAAERVALINPDVEVEAIEEFLTEENALELLAGCDIVLDALDNIAARRILADACEKLNIPLVYGGIRGWTAQAGISLPGDGLIRKIYPETTKITYKSVLGITPALCACMQISLCVRFLIGREVQTGTLFYADLLEDEFEVLRL